MGQLLSKPKDQKIQNQQIKKPALENLNFLSRFILRSILSHFTFLLTQ